MTRAAFLPSLRRLTSLPATAVTVFATFLAGFGRSLWIIREISAGSLTTFASCFRCFFVIICEIARIVISAISHFISPKVFRRGLYCPPNYEKQT